MPQMGYDTKTDRLTDSQSQCDFDFEILQRRLIDEIRESESLPEVC
jgi:hypothetical protein